MKKYTLNQLRTVMLIELMDVKFIASNRRFKKIAKALDRTGIRWQSGCRLPKYGVDSHIDLTYKYYYLEYSSALGRIIVTRGTSHAHFKSKKSTRITIIC